MKTRLIYFIALTVIGAISTPSVYAQRGSMQERLAGKVWQFQYPAGYKPEYEVKYRYGYDRRVSLISAQGRDFSTEQPFYLSDTVDKEFDAAQVGKTPNGKYLVVKGDPDHLAGSFTVFEILKLDGKEFVVKSLRDGSVATYKPAGT